MYTSGSTGVPKGVEVRHRGIVRLLFGVDYAEFDGGKTLLHLAPISFDAATFELWAALLHGGKCVLFPGKVPSPAELGKVLKKNYIDTLWLTASLFNMVIDEEPEALSEIKQLLIGGEALSVSHVRKGLDLLPDVQIINGYGPTESTTFTCCYRIPRPIDDHLLSIPIGKPIGNTQVYILDSYLNPVPMGVTGEIYIGGDGLARGYLNRPELTAERFIYHSFDGQVEQRLYKTGDLARYLADGNIEFLGRIDDQVKIGGYRIELGEIETVLRSHPGVRQCAVTVREDRPDDKRLIGYVVMQPDAQLKIDDLRGFLKQKLPAYMIPSVLVQLDELPLLPNRKVHRKALPAPDGSRPELDNSYVPPRTSIEQTLVDIWREILRLEKVGIHDNFFDLGGHSLLATKIISRVRDALKIDLPLRTLFETPTIQGLAQNLYSGRDERDAPRSLT
jgi:acyl-coenzyme A synthetase/AMP-(fatty) acid ligase/acyl carrier protein